MSALNFELKEPR